MKTVVAVIVFAFLVIGTGWMTSAVAQDAASITTTLKCKSQKLKLETPGDCKSIKTIQTSPPVIACYGDQPGEVTYYYCDGNGDAIGTGEYGTAINGAKDGEINPD